MNNNAPDSLPSVELPSPQQESQTQEYAAQIDTHTEQGASKQVEQGISAPAPVPPHQARQPVHPAAQADAPVVMPHDAPPSGVPGVALTPQIADDSDLIEKEWVDKAKQIVDRTRHDPHQQNREMNMMKADYLKKRYNKDIKLSE